MKRRWWIILIGGIGVVGVVLVIFGLYQIKVKRVQAEWIFIQQANSQVFSTLLGLPEERASINAAEAVLSAHIRFLERKKEILARQMGALARYADDVLRVVGDTINFFQAHLKALNDYSEENMMAINTLAGRINDELRLPKILQGVATIPSSDQTAALQAKTKKLGQLKKGISIAEIPRVSISPLPADPIRASFIKQVRSLIREYEETRKAFQRDLNAGIEYYTQSSAYNSRISIRDRLVGLKGICPPDLQSELDYLIDTVNLGIKGTVDYFTSWDRTELERISKVISSRLVRSKRVF